MSDGVLRSNEPPSLMALVRAIHSAAVDEAGWPDVLEHLRVRLGAQVVTLGHHEFETGADVPLFEAPDDGGYADESAAYAARNPWFMSSDEYVPGRVMTGDDLISPHELRRTDFYRGFLRPRGLLHRLCGVVDQYGRGVDVLSALRSEDQVAFGTHERAELELLLAHVTLSLRSRRRWLEADDLSRALLAFADNDTHPMMLVTADGHAIYRNPAAEQFLDRGLGLRMVGTRVTAASPADRRMLDEKVALVAQAEAASASTSTCVVSLASTGSPVPVIAQLRPLGRMFLRHVGERRGVAMIAVRGGAAVHDAATCTFARIYELTPAQAKVSALVFTGNPLPAIARCLHVSENTVRSHLKQVFQKTGTHGQMELVQLHARVCAGLP